MGLYRFSEKEMANLYVIRSRKNTPKGSSNYVYYTGYNISSSPRFMSLGQAKAIFTKNRLDANEYEILKANIQFETVNL